MSTIPLSLLAVSWRELTPMPQAEAGGAAGWLSGELVVAGGTAWQDGVKVWLSDTQIYNPAGSAWRRGPALSHGLAYGPSVYSSSGLEVFGGTDGRTVYRDSWRLDAGKLAWKRTGDVPADVLLGKAIQLGGYVYLIGGCADAVDLTRCSDAVWRRSREGRWAKIATLPGGPVAMPAVAVRGDSLYIFGGCSMPEPGKVRNHDASFEYDTKKDAWTTLPSLPHPARGLTAATAGGRMYLMGGYTDSGFTSQIIAFEAAARTYRTVSPLPIPLLAFEAVSDGKLTYVTGGEDKPKSRSGRLWVAEFPK